MRNSFFLESDNTIASKIGSAPSVSLESQSTNPCDGLKMKRTEHQQFLMVKKLSNGNGKLEERGDNNGR